MDTAGRSLRRGNFAGLRKEVALRRGVREIGRAEGPGDAEDSRCDARTADFSYGEKRWLGDVLRLAEPVRRPAVHAEGGMYGGEGLRAGTGLHAMMSYAYDPAKVIAHLFAADTLHTRLPSVSHRSCSAGAATGLALDREWDCRGWRHDNAEEDGGRAEPGDFGEEHRIPDEVNVRVAELNTRL